MNVIHIVINETKTIDFDVKHDRFRRWSPYTLEVIHAARSRERVTASIKEITELTRRIEAAMEDVTIDCTDLGVRA